MKINISAQTKLYFLLIFIGLAGFTFLFFLPSPTGFYATIVAAAIAGFGVAANVYAVKNAGTKLVCPTGSDCNVVINSKYAHFFGLNLEYWGMAYYLVIILAYLGLIFVPAAFSPLAVWFIVVISVLAGLFSLYLLFVQAVLLRKWCIWCILSALLSLGICVLSLVSTDFASSLMAQYDYLLQILRTLGMALGLGGATASTLLFSYFLDDKEISEKELGGLQQVFELVWIGLGFVIVGETGLLIAYSDMLLASDVFVAQMISLAVAIVAGAALMIVYAPFMTYVPFDSADAADGEEDDDPFRTLKKPILSLGAVILVSWYFAFFVSFLSAAPLVSLLIIFLALIVSAVVVVYMSQSDRHLISPRE